ncbi:MAG: hypothetical protein IPP46_20415 [Bacteroidetes bacterium]|nr:hypothetical protein [Bacteroidota bacterium]
MRSLQTIPAVSLHPVLWPYKDEFVTLTSPEGAEYLWSTGSISQSIDVSEPGTYTVTVDANTGCATALAPVTVTQLGNGTSKGIEWKKHFPGTGTSGRATAIQQTQDGGYISGDTAGWQKLMPVV